MSIIREQDEDILFRILDYCDRIESCRKRFGDSFESYLKDPDFQDVVKMNLFQIGECVNTLTDDYKIMNSEIPWHEIYGLRNIIAHGYIKIKEERIWHVVQEDIPELKSYIMTNIGNE